MNFDLEKSIEILGQTPEVLNLWLKNLSDEWISKNEGAETWSVYDVVGHLIHGEKTDWIPRLNIIISNAETKVFDPFDRFAQFENSKGKSLEALLKEFTMLRQNNIKILKGLNLKEKDFDLTGIHPDFGKVTLRELLSTWTVHDLSHIAQMARIMAFQYKEAVGPWINYIGLINKK